ncbi:sensor domain-containing diguanylate cyclase [Deinococcus yavapaiensis]|nr:GGDEF domain-containing protein [Deinococcus yavapaiensis]
MPPLSPSVLAAALEHAGIGILITDDRRRVLYVNETFTRDTGYSLDDIRGLSCAVLQGPGTNPADVEVLRGALDRAEPIEQVLLNYRKDGTPLWYKVRIRPMFEDGTLRYFVGVQENYTPLKDLQRQLEHAANTDSLTDLGNRRAFELHLAELEKRAHPFAIVILDVNNLKHVNDSFGHAAGDALIERVASGLRAACDTQERAFRLGGDEFSWLVPLAEAHALTHSLERLYEELKRQGIARQEISVGAAIFPIENLDVWSAVRLADCRMYEQKDALKASTPRA